MALIEHATAIAAPIEMVYRISQDYAVRYDWDPFPERIAVVSGEATTLAVGTQVDIESKLGMTMRVAFVQVLPPTRTAVKMIQGPWFLAKFAGSWIFEATSPSITAARFRYTLVAQPAWLRGLVEPIAAFYFSRVVFKRLAGLKMYCESQNTSAFINTKPSNQ
jgi:Polyketide cyclase / dehydrase and lipid transport